MSKNEIAIATKELGEQFIPGLFNDIDFNGLNKAIENIAEASGELAIEEKEIARNIIDEWNMSVVQRLMDKEAEMGEFLHFFSGSAAFMNLPGFENIEEFGPILAEQTGTQKLFQEYMTAKEELAKHHDETPEAPVKSESTTFEEDIRMQKEHEAAYAVHQLKRTRLNKQHAKAIATWKREMSETEVIKDLLKQARKFRRGAGKMRQDASDKASLAKLNVSISSKVARDSLKELMEFTTKI